jgi:Poly A polymerase head domain
MHNRAAAAAAAAAAAGAAGGAATAPHGCGTPAPTPHLQCGRARVCIACQGIGCHQQVCWLDAAPQQATHRVHRCPPQDILLALQRASCLPEAARTRLISSDLPYAPHLLTPSCFIRRLRSAGFSAFIVGGWVRDRFLGRPASDIDIATNAVPRQLRGLFGRVLELPRLTVKLLHQGEVLELASLRGASRDGSQAAFAADAGACCSTPVFCFYI